RRIAFKGTVAGPRHRARPQAPRGHSQNLFRRSRRWTNRPPSCSRAVPLACFTSKHADPGVTRSQWDLRIAGTRIGTALPAVALKSDSPTFLRQGWIQLSRVSASPKDAIDDLRHHASRLSPHDSRPSDFRRSGYYRDPKLVGPRQPRDHEPLRTCQPGNKAKGAGTGGFQTAL